MPAAQVIAVDLQQLEQFGAMFCGNHPQHGLRFDRGAEQVQGRFVPKPVLGRWLGQVRLHRRDGQAKVFKLGVTLPVGLELAVVLELDVVSVVAVVAEVALW